MLPRPTSLTLSTLHRNSNADEADAARIVSAIKKEFHNVPRLMTVDNSGAAQTVFTFKGPHTEPRKITIGTKLADDVKLLSTIEILDRCDIFLETATILEPACRCRSRLVLASILFVYFPIPYPFKFWESLGLTGGTMPPDLHRPHQHTPTGHKNYLTSDKIFSWQPLRGLQTDRRRLQGPC